MPGPFSMPEPLALQHIAAADQEFSMTFSMTTFIF
jgi:hypothetical protein